jgi:hypothetical protein
MGMDYPDFVRLAPGCTNIRPRIRPKRVGWLVERKQGRIIKGSIISEAFETTVSANPFPESRQPTNLCFEKASMSEATSFESADVPMCLAQGFSMERDQDLVPSRPLPAEERNGRQLAMASSGGLPHASLQSAYHIDRKP